MMYGGGIFQLIANDGTRDMMFGNVDFVNERLLEVEKQRLNNYWEKTFDNVLIELFECPKILHIRVMESIRNFDQSTDFGETGHIGGRAYYLAMQSFQFGT